MLTALVLTGAVVGASRFAQAQSGEEIFRNGDGGAAGIVALLAEGKVRLLAAGFPCASCHGADGTGKREGAGLVPPVTWEALTSPRSGSADLPARPAYDDRSLSRAVTEGIDSAGRTLSAAMPRYVLSPPQSSALVAFMKQLGGDNAHDPGVSPSLIRIGSALPLSGPQASAGIAVRDLLTRIFARESETGIYGRRIELVTADTATEGRDAALRRLAEQEQIFALVATEGGTGEVAPAPNVPVIGVIDRGDAPPAPREFRLGASQVDRVVALLRYTRQQHEGATLNLAVIGPADAPGRAALIASGPAAMRIVLDWQAADQPDAAVTAAIAANAQAILVLSPRDTVAPLQTAMQDVGTTIPLLVPGEPIEDLVTASKMALAPLGREYVRLAFAGLAPDQIDDSGFRAIAAGESVGSERSLLLYETYAAATLLVEALKQAGRRLDRAALVTALETLHDVRTGTLPPITFGRDRDGLHGAAIIGFTADGHSTFLQRWQPMERQREPR